MGWTIRWVTAWLLIAGVAGTSYGQETSQGESDKGTKLAQEGKLDEAIEVWLNLKEMLLPTDPQLWAIHRNVGRSFQKLKQYPEAWWHLQRSVALDKEQAGKAVDWVQQVETELTGLGYVKVRLEVRAAGGSVLMKHGAKERLFSTPLEWWFKPGEVTLKFRAPGFKEATVAIAVAAGQNPAPVSLEKAEAPGILVVNVPYSDAKVWIDGVLVGEGTAERTLPAGNHKIEVRYGERILTQKTVIVQSGRTTVEVVNPLQAGESKGGDNGSGGSVWPWIAGGSALALGLAGGGLFWMASNNLDSASGDYNAGKLLEKDWDARISSDVSPFATGAYICWGLAGAAAVTSVVLFIMDSPEGGSASTTSWLVTPTFSSDLFGVSLVVTH